jgi:hypothetical protein
MKLARTKVEWVAQVSLLRPGFLFAIVFTPRMAGTHLRRNPGLKSETWATHSTSGAALLPTERSVVERLLFFSLCGRFTWQQVRPFALAW